MVKGGQIFCLSMEQPCQIFSLNGEGVITITKQALQDKSNNHIKLYGLGQGVLCEIMPFACQGERADFRLKTKYVKLYKIGSGSLLEWSGNKYFINASYNLFDFKNIALNKKDYYILDNKQSKWLIVLSEESIIYNGKYIDYEKLQDSIKIYAHPPNVYNVGKIVQYNFSSMQTSVFAVKDNGGEIGLVSEDFAEIYFMDAIMCGRIKLAYSRISHELKSSISEQILAEYFGQIDDYVFLPDDKAYITLKNNNIVGVYHIVVNNGWITSIY